MTSAMPDVCFRSLSFGWIMIGVRLDAYYMLPGNSP